MFEKFFGRPFWVTLGSLAVAFLVAILAFPYPWLAALALALAAAGTFAVAWKRLDLGLCIAFAELFANSHGHLVSYEVGGFAVSLRMVVFAALMSAWAFGLVAGRYRVSVRDPRLAMFAPLFLAVGIGFSVGFAQNDALKAFKDGNAYLYLGYLLPMLSVEWNAAGRRLLLQVVAASAAWVSALSLGLLYVFTHFPEWMLGPTYAFVRDTRTGELTKMSGNIFRIFLQSQLSVLFAMYLAAPLLLARDLSRRAWRAYTAVFAVLLSVIIISLSRSFWVGILAGDAALFALLLASGWPGSRAFWRALASVTAACALAVMLLVGIVLFPLPYRVGRVSDMSSLLSERTTDLSDAAVSSRWNLLPPLLDEIKGASIVGSGFGEEVTFKTDDPRARAANPDGMWTTYSLEWGWLELWLKMGVLGPIAFGCLFVAFVRGLWPYLGTDQSWIGVALMSALVMLYATHVFSPYLNHPLGLGLLLLFVPFLRRQPRAERSEVVASETLPLKSERQVSAAPSMSE